MAASLYTSASSVPPRGKEEKEGERTDRKKLGGVEGDHARESALQFWTRHAAGRALTTCSSRCRTRFPPPPFLSLSPHGSTPAAARPFKEGPGPTLLLWNTRFGAAVRALPLKLPAPPAQAGAGASGGNAAALSGTDKRTRRRTEEEIEEEETAGTADGRGLVRSEKDGKGKKTVFPARVRTLVLSHPSLALPPHPAAPAPAAAAPMPAVVQLALTRDGQHLAFAFARSVHLTRLVLPPSGLAGALGATRLTQARNILPSHPHSTPQHETKLVQGAVRCAHVTGKWRIKSRNDGAGDSEEAVRRRMRRGVKERGRKGEVLPPMQHDTSSQPRAYFPRCCSLLRTIPHLTFPYRPLSLPSLSPPLPRPPLPSPPPAPFLL